jgi:hypothetical protein
MKLHVALKVEALAAGERALLAAVLLAPRDLQQRVHLPRQSGVAKVHEI